MEKDSAAQRQIKYRHGDQAILDEIKDLWEALNLYHCERSANFKHHYRGMTFEKRKAALLRKAEGGEMRVDIALDEGTGKSVGYVVSTVNCDNVGEIQSVYVDAACRRLGIGTVLMRHTLEWMDEKAASEKVVEISVGNEAVWAFYGRFGFKPRLTLLKQIKE